MGKKGKKKADSGRYSTNDLTKRIVWIRSAGHCELCGVDLMHDYRIGRSMRWGEVAHILPASPQGPRAREGHDEAKAELFTNDLDNLMLLCPSCHDKIDRDADGYPEYDLSNLHQEYRERIQLAATTPNDGRAIPIIVQSQHFETNNEISERDLLVAMSAEGLTAYDHPIKIIIQEPGPHGRDQSYWQSIEELIKHRLEQQLRRRGGIYGDEPTLAVVGLADIPALIVLGQALGDRSKRLLFSCSREHRLNWPNQSAEPPDFLFNPPEDGDGPLALVLSISAHVPFRDVKEVLPSARIAEITIPEPSYAMVQNRRIIHVFRDVLQIHLSKLEASTEKSIHVFAAIPAALAIEFGALLTTQHQHPYLIFDRDRNNENKFTPTLQLGLKMEEVH